MRTIVSDCTDIHRNLAAEACLVDSGEDVLFLWRNSPAVIIGRYQNPWVECDIARIEQDRVRLARRLSGGGAVYHDLGNLCFTFVTPVDRFSKEANFRRMIDALATLGIEASLSGRNDMLVAGRKFSGSAFQLTRTAGCHHGTLLVDSDLGTLASYLSPSPLKLESHAIKSVSSRVANLSEFAPGLTTSKLMDALCGGTTPEVFDPAAWPQFQEKLEMFSSTDWIRGKTPRFTERRDIRIHDSNVIVLLDVRDGIVADATVSCDSLDAPWLEDYRLSLVGQVVGKPYSACPQAVADLY